MFTGLIEEVGTVDAVQRRSDGLELTVACDRILADLAVDNSVAVQGVCQTVTAVHPHGFTVYAMTETLKKTTLGTLRPGNRVNLERAMRLSDRLGGHLVQGHVDATATVEAVIPRADTRLIRLRIPDAFQRYTVLHGSIAVDGVSLTIAEKQGTRITVSVIPFTLSATTLGDLKPGSRVNLETDIVGKYLEQFTKENR